MSRELEPGTEVMRSTVCRRARGLLGNAAKSPEGLERSLEGCVRLITGRAERPCQRVSR